MNIELNNKIKLERSHSAIIERKVIEKVTCATAFQFQPSASYPPHFFYSLYKLTHAWHYDIIDIVLIIQVGLASFSFPFLFFIYLFFWVKYFSLRFYYVLLLIFTQQADHKPLLHNTQNKWGPIKTLFNFVGLTDRPIKLGPSRLVDLLFHETSLVSFIYLFYFFS